MIRLFFSIGADKRRLLCRVTHTSPRGMETGYVDSVDLAEGVGDPAKGVGDLGTYNYNVVIMSYLGS